MNEARYREAERRLWSSHGVTPIERRIHLARNRVTVRIQEVGDGPPVVFVHGANTSGVSWASLTARLAAFRCIVVDRPGTGLSDALSDRLDARRMASFADTFVADVFDALGLHSGDVVATSLGGYIALRSAAAFPDRVRRMVQFSWPVGAPIAWLPSFMRVMSVPGVGRAIASIPPSDRTVRTTFRRIGHGPSLDAGRITKEDIAAYLALLRDTDTMRNELGPARVFVSARRGLNRMLLPDATLALVTAPTLFLWGENDPFGGPQTARDLVKRLPNATLEILPGAGHAPWLDDVDGCAASVAGFLASIPRARDRTVGVDIA
ncbi:MAG TPA: alpha/beta hydrolase [Candidatus Limnocylindrales bacterium]|nr:alpha/beta hydrolase [Candidatus Limnocylindrales bacterium]